MVSLGLSFLWHIWSSAPTGESPYWYCCYTAPGGQRLKKSTKQTDRAKAWEICVAMVNVDGAIAAGTATEVQLRKVINAALQRIGEVNLTNRQ